MRWAVRIAVLAAVAFLGAAPVASGSRVALAGDGATTTYNGTGPGYDFDLLNSGTTTWHYIYLVGPAGSTFSSGSITGGGTAPCSPGQPDGQPNELECGPFSSGAGPSVHVLLAAVLAAPVACGAPFHVFLNSTGVPPYTEAPDATFGGTCSTPTPPPPPTPDCSKQLNKLAAAKARAAAHELEKANVDTAWRAALARNRVASAVLENITSDNAGFAALGDALTGELTTVEAELKASSKAADDLGDELDRLNDELNADDTDVALAERELKACQGAPAPSHLERFATTDCSDAAQTAAAADARADALADGARRLARANVGRAERKLHGTIGKLARTLAMRSHARARAKLGRTLRSLRALDAALTKLDRGVVAVAKASAAAKKSAAAADAALTSCQGS